MALLHTEAPAAPDDPPAAAPAPADRFKAWLPLLITVLVMPLLAYAMTTCVLLPRLQKGLGIAAAPASGQTAETGPGSGSAKRESVAMNKLLVNVAGTMGSRYLLVSLSLAGEDADFRNRIQEFEPQLRDTACGILQAKTLADLEKPTARTQIKSELISSFNDILKEPLIQDIYFTEFAIQ